MAAPVLEDIQKGWKVFAQVDELGQVEEVGTDELLVSSGRLFKQQFRIPAEYVQDAADGIVDLSIDRETVDDLQK
ncbi:MAG: hypothetical protein ACRDGI_03310 [Candidatus Limnocylindrales bacterium]